MMFHIASLFRFCSDTSTMRFQISLLTFVLLISCAISSTRAQTCFTNTTLGASNTTLGYIATADAAQIGGVFHLAAAPVYNGSAVLAVGDFEIWKFQSAAVCLVNLNTTSAMNVTFLDIGAAAMAVIEECSGNSTDFLGGVYPLTKQDYFGQIVYVLSSNVTSCRPPF